MGSSWGVTGSNFGREVKGLRTCKIKFAKSSKKLANCSKFTHDPSLAPGTYSLALPGCALVKQQHGSNANGGERLSAAFKINKSCFRELLVALSIVSDELELSTACTRAYETLAVFLSKKLPTKT
eukprot:370751-Pelagomonas_calceolata.AAC.2